MCYLGVKTETVICEKIYTTTYKLWFRLNKILVGVLIDFCLRALFPQCLGVASLLSLMRTINTKSKNIFSTNSSQPLDDLFSDQAQFCQE